MSIQFNPTLETIDDDYGLLKGNSIRFNTVLWTFTVWRENHSIDVFIEGDQTTLNPDYKKTLHSFLENIPEFMKTLHIHLLNMVAQNDSFATFMKNLYFIESISIWNEEYDITIVNQSRNQQIIVNMIDNNILDIYIENTN